MPTDLAYDTGLRGLSGPGKDLHTGVWHGDKIFELPVPVDWQVIALWPPTPVPLSERHIVDCLSRPVGQEALRKTAVGKSRPLILVDSTERPTPVARILPHVLWQLRQAGIETGSIRILVAMGQYGTQRPESLIKKLGPAAVDCELMVHDPNLPVAGLGSVVPGVRVTVNREVLHSDLVIGIEGIYPNLDVTPGASLLTGILGAETIRAISARDRSPGAADAAWKRAVIQEIATRVQINTMVSAQVDADRNLVRLACGDAARYYREEMAFARSTFRAPAPDDADVVVANAYPCDLSVATVLHEGLNPLVSAAPGASRILLASCAEGLGSVTVRPWWRSIIKSMAQRHWWSPARRRTGSPPASTPGTHRNPAWLYRPGHFTESLPGRLGEVRLAETWETVVNAVAKEQAHKRFCRVYLYPCSPLQLLDAAP